MLKSFFITLSLFVFLTSTALAHPGHDHSDWLSEVIHASFYISLSLAFTAICFFVYERFIKPLLQQEER